MLTDARSLQAGTVVESEICVVGAGPAGIALSNELDAAGKTVTLVEAGGLGRRDSPKELAVGESVGESYFPLHKTFVHGFGGTSNHWFEGEGFRTRPLDPIDFQRRAAVPHSGWPFGHEELEPYYARAQRFLGVGEHPYEVSGWEELDGAMLDLDPAILQSVAFLVIPGTGVAHYLAQVEASQSLRLVYNAHAARLDTTDGGDRVTELVARVPGGSEVRVRAGKYVLACGGFGNAKLLLLSTGHDPAGLGNGSDVVGRYFMEHIGLRGGRVEPTSASPLKNPTSPYFAVHGQPLSVHTLLSLAPEVLESEGLLNGTFFFERMPMSRTTQAVRSFVVLRRAINWRPLPRDLGAHFVRALSGIPSIVNTAVYEATGRGTADGIQMMAMAEQAPNPDSRVTLSDKENSLGIPRVRLNWRPTSQDISSILRSEAIIAEALRDAGIARVHDPLSSEDVKWHMSGQWHHLGTTRMGLTPDESVVDPDSRVHGIDNLWVTGGSVFPTGGYANPTLTLIALALRLADSLNRGSPVAVSEGQ